MDCTNGYRLRIKSIRDFSMVLDGFRAEATKVLAREFGRIVAAEAIRRLDLESLGHGVQEPRTTPLQDAYDIVCESLTNETNLSKYDCELSIYFVNDAVLAKFNNGNEHYKKLWESRREVFRWGWKEGAPRPRGLSEERWKAREVYWKAAISRPGIGSGLRFNLIDGKPPQLGWNGIRRFIPSLDQRVTAILAEIQSSSKSILPRTDIAELKRKIATTIIRDPGKVHLLSYKIEDRPSLKIKSIANAGKTAKKPVWQQNVIEHADVIKASDGRIFVAVPYVGLDTEDRVFLQVADNEIVITQNAKEYGHVGNVSRSAVDLLRECKTVTMVEVEISDGNRLLRAKHVAIVKDISLTESVSRLFGQWRQGKGKQSRSDGEIKQWESQQ